MARPTHRPAAPVPTRLGPLHVQVTGDGPPTLLWHSLFVDSTTWDRVRPRLATGRRLVLVDGPAHGTNPARPTPFTIDDCVGVALDVLDHLGIDEPVDWLGNAWGGHVGILFAAAHPDRCRSLAAIGAPIHALTPAERRKIRLLSAVYRAGGPGPVVGPLVDALLGPDARRGDPAGAAIVADAFRRADRGGMHAAIRWLSLARRDLTATLDRIVTPTLLGTGTDDPMWTVAQAHAAAARLTHGTAVVLPGAGHVGPLLHAAPALTDLVTAFWTDPAATIAHQRDASTPSASRPAPA